MKIFLPIFILVVLSSTVLHAADPIPLELELLQDQRDQKIDEINRIYKEQLEKLKIKYTKQGNLDAANKVVEILKMLPISSLPEKETRWKWGSGGELVLKPNGIATHTIWKRSGKWRKEEDGSLRLESDIRKEFKVTFKDGVGHVVSLGGGGRTTIVPK